MADFKAAAAAAGLTPEERKEMEAFNKTLSVHRELSNLPQKTAQQAYALKSPEQQAALKRVAGEEDPVTKPQRGWLGTAWHYATAPIVEPVKLGLKGLTEVSDFYDSCLSHGCYCCYGRQKHWRCLDYRQR